MLEFSRCTFLLLWIAVLGFGPGNACVSDELETIDERENENEQAKKDGTDVLKAYSAELLKASKENRLDEVADLTNRLKDFRSSGIMSDEELVPHFIDYGMGATFRVMDSPA